MGTNKKTLWLLCLLCVTIKSEYTKDLKEDSKATKKLRAIASLE
jgi:hypothetical protein